jgi:cation diffusion facilitator family transporter
VAFTLILVKLAAWVATGSVSLLTSAADAIVDAAASLATFAGVRYALRPADRDHRFGHGKGEAIAAFTQAGFLGGAALVLVFQAVARLVTPVPLDRLDLGVWVISGSLVAAICLVMLQSWVVRRTGSTAITADRAHYLTDIAVNAAVLAALFITRATGWLRVDPAFAIGIAVYMLANARLIARTALAQLLDRELPSEDRQRIKEAVLRCPDVHDLHDLRTRSAGDRVFVEFHLEIDGGTTIEHGHEIGDSAEEAVRALFHGEAEVTAHLEPAGIDDERLDIAVRQAPT